MPNCLISRFAVGFDETVLRKYCLWKTSFRFPTDISRDVCRWAVLTVFRDDDSSLSKQERQREEEEGEDRGVWPPTAHPRTPWHAHLLMSHQKWQKTPTHSSTQDNTDPPGLCTEPDTLQGDPLEGGEGLTTARLNFGRRRICFCGVKLPASTIPASAAGCGERSK